MRGVHVGDEVHVNPMVGGKYRDGRVAAQKRELNANGRFCITLLLNALQPQFPAGVAKGMYSRTPVHLCRPGKMVVAQKDWSVTKWTATTKTA